MAEVTYKVLFAKSGAKKRKLYTDGFLMVKNVGSGSSRVVVLSTEDGSDVWKSTEKPLKAYVVGEEITIGSYVVQIDELHDCSEAKTITQTCVDHPKKLHNGGMIPSQNKFIAPSRQISKNPKLPFVQPSVRTHTKQTDCPDSFWELVNEEESENIKEKTSTEVFAIKENTPQYSSVPVLPLGRFTLNSKSFQSTNFGRTTPSSSGAVEQDPALTKLMRPHQIVGADFLIARLLGKKSIKDEFALADSDLESQVAPTGAILADEMGVGKTLTSISTIWAFVRRGGRKCLVICPSSLVDNWLKEIKHWLGTKLKPLALRPGADAAAVINTFAISMASLYPVMVLSYEMFRKHAVLLNTVPNLELMFCDEGHRLKNIGGTKTMDALSMCKAHKRVILSGTPIQNDLEELYAVVSFVAPGFLGSLVDYKSRFSGLISRSNEETASDMDRELGVEAAAQLRAKLGEIMLRRTQADILSNLLPPRHDYVVHCSLTTQQALEYDTLADDVLRSIGLSKDDEDGYNSQAEEDTSSSVGGGASQVLAGLQHLRGICNSSGNRSSSGSKIGSKRDCFASAKAISRTSNAKENSTSLAMPALPGKAVNNAVSSKLQFLMRFLTVLRRKSPAEKVVIVSNFTTALDEIDAAVGGRWGESLRLDGRVPVELRQSLVNRFNRADDPSFLFLLSAKAGGVGINLVGGSRLIMYDVDWNPAIDHQAMSRIWREGQHREVHIYRLVMSGTIEEAILQRQRSKVDLAELVGATDGEATAQEGEGEKLTEDTGGLGGTGGLGEQGDVGVLGALGLVVDLRAKGIGKGKGKKETRMSLTRSDVLQLVYPHRTSALVPETNADTEPEIETGEEVLDSVAIELGSQVVHRAYRA